MGCATGLGLGECLAAGIQPHVLALVDQAADVAGESATIELVADQSPGCRFVEREMQFGAMYAAWSAPELKVMIRAPAALAASNAPRIASGSASVAAITDAPSSLQRSISAACSDPLGNRAKLTFMPASMAACRE